MLTTTVLTNAHKFGPSHFGLPGLYLMPNDDRPDTIVPPTDREARTNPEASRSPMTLRPPPTDPWDTSFLNADDAVFSRAVKMLADAARANDESRRERKRFEEAQLTGQARIERAIEKADQNSQHNYSMLRDAFEKLAESDRQQNRRLAEGDERFGRIERSIEGLKEELLAHIARATEDAAKRIGALEDELARARANREPGPAS
jgi:hypothetical protein